MAAPGPGDVLRHGYLRKLKTMKKKWFVLMAEGGGRLEYYESERKWRAGAAARRVIPLSQCYSISRRLDLKQRHVIALFSREEQFCVAADSEPELAAWLDPLLRLHRAADARDLLAHPIQHVWQVNVQKKGLGAVKNIHGLYNLCLTDKTITLVKIKSHNNIISELAIPEKVEYALKNIRRCGDSECFFYMEVGRQTTTGAGELWMLSEDANIAQSMHSTILHAMRNCSKESENERDHIVVAKPESGLPARRSTYSDGRGRAGLASESALCVGACIRQCVCAARSADDSAASHAGAGGAGAVHAVHTRTRSVPLTGEELDTALGLLPARRASTGARLSKLSPAHNKNAATLRNRCDSMPSRACSTFENERPPPRHNDVEGTEVSRDEADAAGDWYRTPRIPEEPDVCDINKDIMNMSIRGGSYHHSRTSSLGIEDGDADGYLAMAPHDHTDGYLPMAPLDPLGGLVSASSGSVCSGTPSTDPRFSEYQLEPATMHVGMESRPPRAYSVGSRPAPRTEARHRAYSVGARARPAPPAPRARASHDDLMLLDFTPHTKQSTPTPTNDIPIMSRTPPSRVTDEYVDMSPRNAGYVEMKPGELSTPLSTPLSTSLSTPVAEGYVEMTYGKSRPIAIAAVRAPPPPVAASPEDSRFRRTLEPRASHGSQIFEFSGSLESPMSPADDDWRHLATVREAGEPPNSAHRVEASEWAGVSCSPQYVTLKTGEEGGHAPDTDDKERVTAPVVVAGGCALNYAALDLQPQRGQQAPTTRTYTQIDFVRSEKLHAADAT